MRLNLGGAEVFLRAEGLEEAPGGVRLWGREVRVFPPFPAKGFFRHGWQSWSLAAWVDPAQAPTPLLPEARRPQADDPFLLEAGAWWGSGVGALRGPDGRALLLGALELLQHLRHGGRLDRESLRQGLRGDGPPEGLLQKKEVL